VTGAHGRGRPTLALLVDNLYDRFEGALWDSVVQTARAEGADLLCFLGGNLGRGPAARNRVLDYVVPERVDVVVAVLSSIGCFSPPEATRAFVERLAPLPVVSVGLALPGVPSLLVDNATGFAALMDHVAGLHGRRRIAFVRGPPANPEAEGRYRAYLEGLSRHGLRFDPALVVQGNFDRESGRVAVEALFDGAAAPPDAVVAANDDMALYAVKTLQLRGTAVPDDVLVTGFDDVLPAGAHFPGLTTVRQPVRALGEEAVRRALALLRGERVPAVTVLPTELVVRRSCGCPPRLPVFSPARPSAADPLDVAGLADVVALRFPALEQRLGAGWARPLAYALVEELGAPPAGRRPLLEALEALAASGVAHRLDVPEWRPAVEALLAEAPRCGARTGPLSVLHGEVMTFLAELALQAETAQRIKADEEATLLRRVCPPAQLSEAEFKRVLLAELPLLGTRSLFLCRYEPGDLDKVSLLAHYDLDGAVVLDPAPRPFDPRRLIPGQLAQGRRHAFAIIPVHYQEESIGYAVCQLGPMELVGYEVLGEQLGTALQVGALMGAVRQHSEDLEGRVEERTRELREAHARLLETAHRAGMAEIAIGVMHDVGNLLNSVNVSADRIGEVTGRLGLEALLRVTELLDAHRGSLPAFFAADPRGPLVPEYLRKLAEALEGERQRIQAEARELTGKTALIHETVRGLQEYARGEREARQLEPLDLAAVAEAALRIEEPALLRHGIEVVRAFLPAGPVHAHRAKLVHVLVNLVKNAVEAMRAIPGGRRLTLEIAQQGPRALVRVRDNGEGIRPEHLGRLFAYGFTTKPDGHGFGLHACREHLAGLGGTLTAESEGVGRGATFTISLPTPERS
jgi:DNA-binding LacI/PurR family transcriptional regulator/signal transduction histidine kinase